MEASEDLVRRLKRLELIHRVSRELNNSLDAGALLPRVLKIVLDAVEAEAGSIWLIKGDKILCDQAMGGAGERIIGMELPRGAGVVGSVAERKRPEIVLDAMADKRHLKQVDDATGFQVRSMITVPLLVRGQSLGALQVLNKKGEGAMFTREDGELVQEIGLDAATVVRNARLLQTERRAREMSALLKMSREITSTLDIDRILTTAVNILSGIVQFDRCAIALERGDNLEVTAISGKEIVDREAPEVQTLETFLAWISGFKATVYSPFPESMEEDEKKAEKVAAHAKATEMKAVLCIPLQDDSGFIGMLSMESKKEEFLEEGQQELVETFANQVAVALRNADLYRQTPLVSFLSRRGEGGLAGSGRGGLWDKPWVRRSVYAAVAVLLLAIIPAPRRASGEAEVLPVRRWHLRAESALLVESIQVEEGQMVKKGQVLGELRQEDIRIQIAELDARIRSDRATMAEAAAAGNVGVERTAREQFAWHTASRSVLEARLKDCTLVSPVDGFILTHRPRDLVGMRSKEGEPILTIAEAGGWVVEIKVPQEDIADVEPGKTVQFVSGALPGDSFPGKVVSVGVSGETDEGGTLFPVTAEIEDPGSVLRSGMKGRGRIGLGWQSLGGRLFGGLIHWFRWKVEM